MKISYHYNPSTNILRSHDQLNNTPSLPGHFHLRNKLIMAHCEHLYNVINNWKLLLFHDSSASTGQFKNRSNTATLAKINECTFKRRNTGQNIFLYIPTLYTFFSIYSKIFSDSITQNMFPHTCARTFPITICIEHIDSKAPGSSCITCRHFWMQAEGQTSRRWCTWGGYWWQEFSITVRAEVRAGMWKVLDEEMKERMRQWMLYKRRQKAVL